MSHFITKELTTIQLDEKYWVKIPKEFSFYEAEKINNLKNQQDNEVGVIKQILLILIKEWNLEDDGGVIVPVNDEYVSLLKPETINKIVLQAYENITQKKTLEIESESSPKQ